MQDMKQLKDGAGCLAMIIAAGIALWLGWLVISTAFTAVATAPRPSPEVVAEAHESWDTVKFWIGTLLFTGWALFGTLVSLGRTTDEKTFKSQSEWTPILWVFALGSGVMVILHISVWVNQKDPFNWAPWMVIFTLLAMASDIAGNWSKRK